MTYRIIDLRHQYGISAAESQTFLRAKRLQRRRARGNGCFRRLSFYFPETFVNGNNPCSNGRRLCGLDWLESRRVVPVFKFEILVETTRDLLACVAGVESGKKGGGWGERWRDLPFSPFLFPRFRAFLPLPSPSPFCTCHGRRQLRFPSFLVKRFLAKTRPIFCGQISLRGVT